MPLEPPIYCLLGGEPIGVLGGGFGGWGSLCGIAHTLGDLAEVMLGNGLD